MRLYAEDLINIGACVRQTNMFQDDFPEGLVLTPKGLTKFFTCSNVFSYQLLVFETMIRVNIFPDFGAQYQMLKDLHTVNPCIATEANFLLYIKTTLVPKLPEIRKKLKQAREEYQCLPLSN